MTTTTSTTTPTPRGFLLEEARTPRAPLPAHTGEHEAASPDRADLGRIIRDRADRSRISSDPPDRGRLRVVAVTVTVADLSSAAREARAPCLDDPSFTAPR